MGSVFVHAQGICESGSVGDNTRIWAFSHVLPGATIGTDCNLCDHVLIENDVQIGNRVTIKSGVQLWDGVRVADDVFIGPNVTFTNDRFPRSKHYPEQFANTVIEQGASIGGNATLLPGIRVGAHAMVGAGAVVTHDVPPKAVVYGNPARISGYVTTSDTPAAPGLGTVHGADCFPENVTRYAVDIGDSALYRLGNFRDLRGNLSVADFSEHLPFVPARLFMVYGVPSNKVRGEHAHRECGQFLVAVHGSLSVVVDNGTRSREIGLNSPEVGLYIPPMVWGIQYKFTADAVLMVLASQPYQTDEYIRDYNEFLALAKPTG